MFAAIRNIRMRMPSVSKPTGMRASLVPGLWLARRMSMTREETKQMPAKGK
jgi:hypothetical protein